MSRKFFYPLLAFSVFILDRMTKSLVLAKLHFSSVDVLPFLNFTYVENTGIAFGMLKNANLFFAVFNSAFLAVLLYIRRKFTGRFEKIGIHLVIGGALGNIYDRIAYGFVVDFVDLKFFPAVFNVADFAISAGAVLIGYNMFFSKEKGAV